MSTTSLVAESVHLRPTGGCGSMESPWTGWETQLESSGSRSKPRTILLAPGFYGVSRPVRLTTGTTLIVDRSSEGRAWFVPLASGATLETLFLLDGVHEVRLTGICLNGRERRAKHGLLVRCGTAIQIEGCRFGDFLDETGAAVLVSGESQDRHVRGVVVKDCLFLNGETGLRFGRDASDLLVTGNQFEGTHGPALLLDPKDHWSNYDLIFVQNTVRSGTTARTSPFVRVLPGAESIRLAENTFEGPPSDGGANPWPGVEIHGGGPVSSHRLELLLNRLADVPGPGILARHCGPGFLAAGNHTTSCGTETDGSIQLTACHGVLIEDNEVEEPRGPGLRASDCQATRLNGNSVLGHGDRAMPRAGSIGVRVDGEGTRRLRLTDNKVAGMKISGMRIDDGVAIRIVGNEVEDCGEGVHVTRGRNVVIVGNDCRDNGGGLRIDREVRRGLVALNYAILNGPIDLEVLGDRIRCHSNKVDREGRLPGQ